MSSKCAIYSSPIGYLRIEHRDNRLTLLHILQERPAEVGEADHFTDMVFGRVMEYLQSGRTTFDVEMDLRGCTPFQRRVYQALQTIPYAERRSYKDIAAQIGNPKAARAVGMANNRNPIHIILPCHRVVGTKGALTGYAAGVDVKERLLLLEKGE